MNTILQRALLLTLLMFIVTSVPMTSQASPNPSGQLVIKLNGNKSADALLGELHLSATVIDSLSDPRVILLQIADTTAVAEALAVLDSSGAVGFAHSNYSITLPMVNQVSISFPDENRPPLVSGTSPSGYFQQPLVFDVGVDSANILATGEGQTVAIIDNGVELTHPLFADRLVPGFDYLDNDADPSEVEGPLMSHGTFVSGLVALTAPDASIMPLRAFDENGMGTVFAVTQSIYYAINNGATVINMSFNMDSDPVALRDAVAAARNAGIALVASAGNDSTSSVIYPAAYSGVIGVSSYDSLETSTDFTNFGTYVDVCAPGVDIYSSLAGEYEWGTWSGTSFSAATVSGVCALVRSFAGASVSNMETHIQMSARRNLLSGWVDPQDSHYGWGAINAWNGVFSLDHGDWDLSGEVDGVDLAVLADYLFQGQVPESPERLDANCDGVTDSIDLSVILNYLYFQAPIDPCYPPLSQP